MNTVIVKSYHYDCYRDYTCTGTSTVRACLAFFIVLKYGLI